MPTSQFFGTLTLASGSRLPIKGKDPLVTLARNRLRVGEIAGIEERVNGEIRVRATVEAYDPNKKDGVMHVPKGDMLHLDAPEHLGGERFVMISEGPEAVSRLGLYYKKTGQYAPGPDDPGGIRDPFLRPGQTGAQAIDDAVWDRGGPKGTGQTDASGPGSVGNQDQPAGQGADDGQGIAGDTSAGPSHGGATNVPGHNVGGPGGTTTSELHPADLNQNRIIEKSEAKAWNPEHPDDKVEKGPY
jgi:hypothetical protein